MWQILPAFDVFALSSRFEGLSIALVEAMASGVPAVATAVGGVPEVVTNEVDGLLVPSGDPAAMASALGRVLDDRSLRERFALRARHRAADFDVCQAVRFMEAWYDEVLQ